MIDTPGLRHTNDQIEAEAIRQSEQQIRGADLIILMLDASRPLESGQAELLHRFSDATRVINKVDLPREWDTSRVEAIKMVATSGQGVEQLIEQVLSRFSEPQIVPDRPRCWTERQREIVGRPSSAL